MTDKEQIAKLKEALLIASKALDIASGCGLTDVQVQTPPEWNLEAVNEDPEEGWCSTSQLSRKLKTLSQ